MLRLLPLGLALCLALVAGRAGAAGSLPDDLAWALVAPRAMEGAAAGAAVAALVDTRGLQQGFAGGLRVGLGFDPFDLGQLAAAGVDLQRPISFGGGEGVDLAALTLRAGDEGEAHLRRWLEGLGEVTEEKAHRGWRMRLARREGRVVAGMATAGRRVITARLATPGARVEQRLKRAVEAALGSRPLSERPLFREVGRRATEPWLLWLERREGSLAAALAPGADGILTVRGRARIPGAAGMFGKQAAYPAVASRGDLLVGRFAFSRTALHAGGSISRGILFLLDQACSGCEKERLAREANLLAAALEGPAVLAVSRLETGALGARRPLAAATPFAWVAKVRDRAAAEAALGRIAKLLGAENGAIPTAIGTLHYGLSGDRIHVASEPALRDRLLAATEGAVAGAGDPVVLRIDPPALGASLARLSMRDALRGGPLASLFALRLQLGPMLQASGPLEIRSAPAGRDVLGFEARWRLRAD